MHINFTNEAIQYIQTKLKDNGLKLKFLHDSAGCGCADSGVPTLAFVKEATPYDKVGTSNFLPFYYQPEHAVYYEENVNIGFNKNYHCLTLSSDAQLYSNAMRLITI